MSKRLDRRQHRETQIRIRRMIGLTAALIGAIAVATISMTVKAEAETQTPCAPRAQVLEALTGNYAEQSVGMGLASNGGMAELFVGKDSASWTIVVTLPNGMSCAILDGEGWEKLPIKVAGRAS